RYASISPDGKSIAFTHKGDLYIVPAEGGEGRALTFHVAHDYGPVWSNDGSKICFASNRFGNFDLFVISAQGGEAKRLTYHSKDEVPYTFSTDDKYVLFGAARLDAVNHRQYPTSSQPELYKVAVEGSNVDQVWTIPAQEVQMSNDGKTIIYQDKKGGEDVFRKHHVSAITRDIWKYDVESNKHEMLITWKGEDRNPVFAPNQKTIYFLSERSGSFNVHSTNIDKPDEVKQVTSFEPHPVRYLSIAKNGLLCFTYNGSIYTKKEGEEPQKVNVEIRTESKDNRFQLIGVSGNVSEMAISPDGKEVAYVVRGEVFVSSVKGDMHKRITTTPAPERFVSFSPDGEKIIYASERNAKWSIFEASKVNENEPYFFASTLIKEEPVIDNENNNYEPIYSPDGKEIAFTENRRFLKIYTIDSKETRTLLTDDKLVYMSEGDQYYTWSPDSKWLLVEYSPVLANAEVLLVNAQIADSTINLTKSGYGDYSPKWVNGGKQILWFSDRHGLRSYANSGSRQMDAYSMFLTKEGWDRFNLSKDEYALLKEIEKKEDDSEKDMDDKKSKKRKKKDKESEVDSLLVKFDWDGLSERKKRLTIHSSKLGDAVLSKDGEKLFYLARFEKGMDLWETNLRTKETKMLLKLGVSSGSLQWDKKMENLFLLADGKIATIDVDGKEKKSISLGGEMMLDVVAERQQMFDHVWERNKGMFYISGYHGADWDMLRENYEPKLANIGNDFEFVELLSEMLGELNVSHSGARYRFKSDDADHTASLGIFIDYNHEGDGLKIAEVLKGGPLDKEKIDIEKGMIITEIDGVSISNDVDYAKYLNRKAGKYTSLKVRHADSGSEKYITVKPISLSQERTLLYDRWVRQNEEEVKKISNGTIGYVHIPGMSDGPYRNTYEKVMGKYYDCDGLIVDTRFNGGGDLVGDLSMFLTGENFMQYAIEDRPVGYEPAFRWTKPSVAMVNEANYSDGHCFSCMYKDLGIGKLIGMPVPGTCSFAGWEMLQSGTVLWGSIPVSAKNKAGEWLENNETVPDVQIKNMPGEIVNGRDQQLEKAVEEIMGIVE
ncbi:MAG: S41 family peptidase, partial [Salinivirgaceae bacterium]